VDHTPRWVAPNLITFVGLCLIIMSHTMLAWFDPDLTGNAPSWVFALQGICLFVYSTLDNMDGKQARRTGSSSSLGLLFDHGCDAVNAGMLSATSFCCAIGAGPSIFSYIIFLTVIFPFYFASWEEFHLHDFVLPIINGPNEGILSTVIVYFVAAASGGAGWTATEAFGGFTWFHVVMFLACTSATGTCVMQGINVYKRVVVQDGGSFKPAFQRLIPLLAVSVSGLFWCITSPSLMSKHIRLLYLICGSVFADSVMKLLLAHVCKQAFVPSYTLLLMLPLGPINAVLGGPIPEVALLWTMCGLAMANLAFFVFVCTSELKQALGVQCFSIKPSA